MISSDPELHAIKSKKDLVGVRKRINAWALSLGMSSMKENEFRTAVTELLTNIIKYAGEGTISIEQIEQGSMKGIRAVCDDRGPGIEDLNAALARGFSTGKSLGHGLSGCRNLVDTFEIESRPGKGTRVVIAKWC